MQTLHLSTGIASAYTGTLTVTRFIILTTYCVAMAHDRQQTLNWHQVHNWTWNVHTPTISHTNSWQSCLHQALTWH